MSRKLVASCYVEENNSWSIVYLEENRKGSHVYTSPVAGVVGLRVAYACRVKQRARRCFFIFVFTWSIATSGVRFAWSEAISTQVHLASIGGDLALSWGDGKNFRMIFLGKNVHLTPTLLTLFSHPQYFVCLCCLKSVNLFHHPKFLKTF